MVSDRRSSYNRPMYTSRERAQLLLIAGVIIAAFVLSTIVLLNLLHESPEFQTEQEGHSVVDAERLNAQLHHDLEQYFLAYSADDSENLGGSEPDDVRDFRLPFADPSFAGEIDAYDDAYMTLAAGSRAALVDIEFDESASQEGAAVWSNTSDGSNPASGGFLDGAETVPVLDVTLDGLDDLDIGFYQDENNVINVTIRDDMDVVEVDGESACDVDSQDDELRLRLVHGVGEFVGDNTYCQLDAGLEELGTFDVELWYAASIDMEYVVTGSGSDATVNSDFRSEVDDSEDWPDIARANWYRENVLVDPVFDVSYQDPSITYDGTIELYREGPG